MKTYVPPTDDELARVLFYAEDLFSPLRTELPYDWDSRSSFEKVTMQLDRTSSPGWPLCQESSTIGGWLFGESLFPNAMRLEQLWTMVNLVFSGEYFHAFKIFIKQEPHSKKKQTEGRWRLIMMSSLPVQVAWHMAFSHLQTRTLKTTGLHPLRHGMVYYGGGWKRFHAENICFNRDYALDMSAWDWNSHLWPYRAMQELYVRLTAGATNKWVRVFNLLFEDAFVNKKILLPDGTILQQCDDGGLMPSGLVPTIDLNGSASQLVDVLARFRLGIPQDNHQVRTGDDALITRPLQVDLYVSALEQAGCVVKEHFQCEEFMGFEIKDSGFYPKYLGKHLLNLKSQKDEHLIDSLDGYLRIYVYDVEMFNFFKEVARFLGIEVRSRQYYLYFAEHPDALEPDRAKVLFRDRFADVDVVS